MQHPTKHHFLLANREVLSMSCLPDVLLLKAGIIFFYSVLSLSLSFSLTLSHSVTRILFLKKIDMFVQFNWMLNRMQK